MDAEKIWHRRRRLQDGHRWNDSGDVQSYPLGCAPQGLPSTVSKPVVSQGTATTLGGTLNGLVASATMMTRAAVLAMVGE